MKTKLIPCLVGLALAVSIAGAFGAEVSFQTNSTHVNSSAEGAMQTVTIRAQVPAGVGTVYLTGNRPEIGNWNPCSFAMTGTNQERVAVLRLPVGTSLEYKFTLGSWDREGLGPSGTILPNHRLTVGGDQEVTIAISDFRKETPDYLADWKGSGVLGRLEYWTNVPSKFLSATRHVEIWLPPGYDDNPTNRYDVLYMHDGQNLFDPRIANTGVDWGVDEAIMRGVNAGKIKPVIVVGVWCTDQRLREYSPWHDGTNYAKFLIEELMPQVNAKFRTCTGPKHTTVMGSSLGGLISFWLCWKYPETFGSGGCLSSGLMWNGSLLSAGAGRTPLIERELAGNPAFPCGTRLYFDYGTREGSLLSFENLHAMVGAWLKSQGWREGEDFVMRVFPGAEHNEAAWRARLDEPLTFLLGNSGRSVDPKP